MARTMGNNGDAFRAKIAYKFTDDGPTYVTYEGPYATAGVAKSRLTWANRRYKDRLIEAVVEQATTNWQPVS